MRLHCRGQSDSEVELHAFEDLAVWEDVRCRFTAEADEGLEAIRLDPDAPEIWEFLRNAGREAGRENLRQEARRQLDRPRSPRP